jgi:hypothetical protein
MRRDLLLLSCLALVATAAPAFHANAQQGDDDARRRAQADSDKKKAEKEKQWALPQAELPTVKNVGPCPYVKVLYDAARYEEFKDKAAPSPASVGFTGEIAGLSANCQYKGGEPIDVQLAVGFALGRGPMAGASAKDYHYWVAVTPRNSSSTPTSRPARTALTSPTRSRASSSPAPAKPPLAAISRCWSAST